MQVNSVGRHLACLGLYYPNVTAMFANTDSVGNGFKCFLTRSVSGSDIPCKEQVLPLTQWGRS